MVIRWSLVPLFCLVSVVCYGQIPVAVESTFNRLIPGVLAKNIKQAPMSGWYQGQVGSRIFYLNETATYLLDGHVFDVKNRENLTENALKGARRQLMATLDVSSMVVFEAPDERHQITVFTDVDCGYCRKLHNTLPDYHKRGITVRYLAYPRAGVNSKTGKIMQSAWCAENPGEALTDAKQGQRIDDVECENPVAEHYQVGNAIGVNGTPAILFDSGQLVPGFVKAGQLLKMLNES
ncbi:MAG: DsbC family protein [Immundisolibacteraceae bacterium]|nr:DsbC family protein [Immundisolibacteraceae bacterium]